MREVQVIPNGTDTQPLAELESKQFGVPLRLVAVSRLAPNKRVDHAVQAAKLLVSRGTDCYLTAHWRGVKYRRAL